MIWYAAVTFVLLCIGSWATFTDDVRQGRWYTPLMVVLSAGNAAVFALAARALNDKPAIFVLSLVLDGLMVAAYYLLPLMVLGVKLNAWTLAGAVVVVIGFVFIKLGA